MPERIRLQTMLRENWVYQAPFTSRLMMYLEELGLVTFRARERDWCLTELGLRTARDLANKEK